MGQNIGYCEMYEWAELPKDKNKRYGIFVESDIKSPEKIRAYTGKGNLIGVSTVLEGINTDNPPEWPYKYYINEIGDTYYEKKDIALAKEVFDSLKEFSYISTFKKEVYKELVNDQYNDNLNYIKRENRIEWTRVNILGKCIVRDNGKCIPGQYCKPYIGEDESLIGYAIPCDKDDKNSFYILGRISTETILILNK